MKQSPFRSIRQTLFNEGKLLRYLGYAVGEIALIIIGIMLALQLNNWNEDRKAQAELDAYVVQLRLDVQKAVAGLKANIELSNTRAQKGFSLIQFLEDPKTGAEALATIEDALNQLGRAGGDGTTIKIGLLGKILDGNTEVLSQNKQLAKKVLQLEYDLEVYFSLLRIIKPWIDNRRGEKGSNANY